jgi:hypothetical protein
MKGAGTGCELSKAETIPPTRHFWFVQCLPKDSVTPTNPTPTSLHPLLFALPRRKEGRAASWKPTQLEPAQLVVRFGAHQVLGNSMQSAERQNLASKQQAACLPTSRATTAAAPSRQIQNTEHWRKAPLWLTSAPLKRGGLARPTAECKVVTDRAGVIGQVVIGPSTFFYTEC